MPSSVHTFLTTPIPTRGVINYTWCAPMCYPHIHGVPGLIRSAQRQITAINLRHRVDYRLTPAYNIRANRLNSGLTSSPFHTTHQNIYRLGSISKSLTSPGLMRSSCAAWFLTGTSKAQAGTTTSSPAALLLSPHSPDGSQLLHPQLSAAQGSPTSCLSFDIRLI